MNTDYLIPSGLSDLPRQIGLFPEFRDALLAAIPGQPALNGWRARRQDDFGVMLLEMWAYCCDVLSFYDETIANECYVRTARQRASLRRLVGLLGYLPRPALAASVNLALLADGRQPVSLPAGIAFRSSAFSGNAPQVFEMDEPAVLAPQNNRLILNQVRPTRFTGGGSSLLIQPGDANVIAGDSVMLLQDSAPIHVCHVASTAKITGDDGGTYVSLGLDNPVPGCDASVSQLQLNKALRKAGLWNMPNYSPYSAMESERAIVNVGNVLFLNGVYPDLKNGDLILVASGQEVRWFSIEVTVAMMQCTDDNSTSITQDETTYTIYPPTSQIPATRIALDVDLNDPSREPAGASDWDSAPEELTVYYNFAKAGTIVLEASPVLAVGDELSVSGTSELVTATGNFLLADADQNGVGFGGTLNAASRVLSPDQDASWDPPLIAPVTLFGNVVGASRGQTVSYEIVGSGDASVPSLSFQLKKKPLTYLADNSGSNDLGAASTLKLYVNNVLWKEVPSFFGAGPGDWVYIVRQNDDGDSVITGGDGVRGARFPTGTNNLVAFYRYGAGAASPPAGGITQLAKPVPGVKSVYNPVAALPGADAQDADNLRNYAPKSALLLGRAVSIQDFEAAAATVPGVRAVQAQWYWNLERQQPVVQIWVIGPDADDFRSKVLQMLHALCDPAVPIDVKSAQGLPGTWR